MLILKWGNVIKYLWLVFSYSRFSTPTSVSRTQLAKGLFYLVYVRHFRKRKCHIYMWLVRLGCTWHYWTLTPWLSFPSAFVALPSPSSHFIDFSLVLPPLCLSSGFPSKFSDLELDLGDFLYVLLGHSHPPSFYDSKMCASSSDLS